MKNTPVKFATATPLRSPRATGLNIIRKVRYSACAVNWRREFRIDFGPAFQRASDADLTAGNSRNLLSTAALPVGFPAQ